MLYDLSLAFFYINKFNYHYLWNIQGSGQIWDKKTCLKIMSIDPRVSGVELLITVEANGSDAFKMHPTHPVREMEWLKGIPVELLIFENELFCYFLMS
jgi:hypothetical protein